MRAMVGHTQRISVELIHWKVALSRAVYIFHIVCGEDIETTIGRDHTHILNTASTHCSHNTSLYFHDTNIRCRYTMVFVNPDLFLSRQCPYSLSPRYRRKGVSRSLLCRTAGVLTVWYVPLTALKMSSCDMLHAIISLGSRLASPATMTRPHSADLPLNTTLKKLFISSLTGPVRQL